MPTQAPVLHDAGPKEKTICTVSGIAANVAAKKLMTADATGLYRVSCYWVNTTAGTGGDALPDVAVSFTDDSGTNAVYMGQPPALTIGSIGYTTAPIWCITGDEISYTISGGTYSTLKFCLHFVIETVS